MEENLDFQKICRVCLNGGVMMSIFKVNISKKLMACASVQVWQKDGLPTQICQKCSAKLHISFQFKKLCEKSDGKLRQYLTKLSERRAEQERQQPPPMQTIQKVSTANLPPPYNQSVTQNNCVFIECNPLIENISHENNFIPVNQSEQPQIQQIDYNQLSGYNVEGVGQVQVFNGSYNMPLEHTNVLHNQEMQPMQMDPQTQPQQPQVQYLDQAQQQQHQEQQQLVIIKEEEEKAKNNRHIKPLDSSKQCEICNKIFSTPSKLNRHMKTHASDLPYKCKACNKGFAHSGNFKIHLRMHTGERPFRCVVCDKGCRQAQDLEKHMRTHTGERPHKCLMCPKAFSTRSNLIAHIRIHTGERPYVCCVCQKSFCQSNELTKHMRTHTGEKSHICDICNKGFNGSSTLIVHRRSHTGERPYVCAICNKGFSQNSCLSIHLKRHNLNDQCDNNFNTKPTDNKEMVSAEKKFTCSFCNCDFKSSDEYNEHLKTHSTGREES